VTPSPTSRRTAGFEVEWAGEGEWKITLDALRDLGPAFLAALLAIFGILTSTLFSLIVVPVVCWLAYGPGGEDAPATAA